MGVFSTLDIIKKEAGGDLGGALTECYARYLDIQSDLNEALYENHKLEEKLEASEAHAKSFRDELLDTMDKLEKLQRKHDRLMYGEPD